MPPVPPNGFYQARRCCDYCFRQAEVTVHLRQGFWRTVLFLPERTRQVCGKHLTRIARPGAWRA